MDSHIDHNSCISHCLPYTFGKCISKYETQYSDCDQLFEFLDFLYKSVSPNSYFQIIESKEKLLYYLLHQIRKKYLNVQFKVILSELDSDSVLFIADYKMCVLPNLCGKQNKISLENVAGFYILF